MRKLLAIMAITCAAFLGTGCDIDADPEGGRMIVIDNIYVETDGWNEYTVDGRFTHLYADIPMPEITEYIFDRGVYTTYWKYNDQGTPVQVPLTDTMYPDRFVGGQWLKHGDTMACTYSVGNMRIEIRRSDGSRDRPSEKLYFRTVIYY